MKLLVCLFALSLCLLCQAKPLKLDWSRLLTASIKTEPFSPPVINNCTKPDDVGQIISVTFDPAEPKKGDDVTIKAVFKLKGNVTSGSIKVDAKFDGAPLISETLDLCAVAAEVGLSCPLTVGTHTVTASATIPGLVPSGTYSGDGVITDQNDKEVACGSGSYKL